MPRPALSVRRVEVGALPIYICVDCGTHGIGQTVRIHLHDVLIQPAEIGEQVSKHLVTNEHMPEEWVGYGSDTHRCEACARKRRRQVQS